MYFITIIKKCKFKLPFEKKKCFSINMAASAIFEISQQNSLLSKNWMGKPSTKIRVHTTGCIDNNTTHKIITIQARFIGNKS